MRPISTLPLLTLLAVAGSCGRAEPPDLHGPQAERLASALVVGGGPMTDTGGGCCVPADGTTDHMCGTRTPDNWCCGNTFCIDPVACGNQYHQIVRRCADCNYYNCNTPPPRPDPPPPPICHPTNPERSDRPPRRQN
jgi:hypothetical protein